MFKQSMITKTHQWWKYLLGMAALFAGMGTLMTVMHGLDLDYTLGVPLTLLSLGTFILGIAFPAVTIKCPGCGLHWVWYAWSKKPRGQWFIWLVATEHCPECGYPTSDV